MAQSPINILYVIDRFSTSGGTEAQLAGLIARLDRRRFRPYLCVFGVDRGDCSLLDCGYLELEVRSLGRPSSLVQANRLRRYLAERRIEIVQSFFQDATILAMPIARLARVPARVISFRDLGFWRTPRIEFLMRRAYRFATGYLANSQAVRQTVVERDGVAAERIEVIPNGIDTARISFRRDRVDPIRVVFLGNLNRRVKRPDLFIEAAARLVPAYPHVEWVCIGSGRHRELYERQVAEAGLGDRFRFLGRRDDVPELLQQMEIGVNCSDSEGLANAVLEYMLAGTAVVATDVGGNRELVANGRTGLLVPPGDAASLAAAIETLLVDPKLANDLRRRAREQVESAFDWDSCVEHHQDFYLRQWKAGA